MDPNLTESAVWKHFHSRMMAIDELRKRGAKAGKDFFIGGKSPTTENDLKVLLVKDLPISLSLFVRSIRQLAWLY